VHLSACFLSVRQPVELRRRLDLVAARRGISLQQLVLTAMEELLMSEEAERR
jgi:hypothetical protein